MRRPVVTTKRLEGRRVVFALLLPWFPILIAVAVSGRLLGAARGLVLGGLCALFWVTLVQASIGAIMWQYPWTVATVVAGSVAIVAVGRWAGEMPLVVSASQSESSALTMDARVVEADAGETVGLRSISAAMEQFDDWLAANKDSRDPWPAFGEFVRGVIYRCCRGTHVKTYRLVSEGRELAPLHDADSTSNGIRLPAREGVLGHVITTGRRYVAGLDGQGDLLERLAEASGNEDAWCFAVREGPQRFGAVSVGHLDMAPHGRAVLLSAVEGMVSRFWCMLTEVCHSRHVEQEDAVSGAQTRPAFLRAGERTLADSYRLGEPVAVVVFALEGLRQISDSGRWELGDELLRDVCDVLRRKVRMDDHVGRFDGSQFVLLLRRVDSGLASLIVNQMMTRLHTLVRDEGRWLGSIRVRSGLFGSGTQQPSLHELVSRALVQCRRAREEDLDVASDLEESVSASEVLS